MVVGTVPYTAGNPGILVRSTIPHTVGSPGNLVIGTTLNAA